MKKITFTILALATVLFSSCFKDNNNNTGFYYDPYFVAERNGLAVYAYPGSAKVGADSIQVSGRGNDAAVRMNFKYTGKGTYALVGNQAKYYQLVGNDTVSRYNIGVANGSAVEVTAIDSINKVIGGKFTLKFKRTFPATSSTYPDSVKFLKGQFVIALPR
ncbi:hypothetical protein D0C36_11680 [Mucilaginibacter conchicola]|uniref:DUF4843 domain-containing protein n=1 Tax=Mucilaginibacter conchicola TaxID=2303333 RepID=A0A372NTU5_9SPHI|nr:DUF6252 family protein [Mucilaginibacter conchicola]RFZ92099.1 hypothetical protein D0C36_11680 [Mucilaginibacter conchicola]